jgi:hypothetical protein
VAQSGDDGSSAKPESPVERTVSSRMVSGAVGALAALPAQIGSTVACAAQAAAGGVVAIGQNVGGSVAATVSDAASAAANTTRNVGNGAASYMGDSLGSAVQAVRQMPGAVIGGIFGGIGQMLWRIVEKALQVAFFFASAVSCYFVGLFANIGIEYFSVVDKQSLLGSIFLLTAVFSSIRVLIFVVPGLLAEAQPKAEKACLMARFSGGKQTASTPGFVAQLTGLISWLALPITIAIFALVMLGGELGLIFAMVGVTIVAVTHWLPLKFKLIGALLAGLAFGFLRAEHLQTSSPTMNVTVRQPDGAVAIVPANVIMSADRGLLLVTTSDEAVRYVPWEQIAAVDRRDRRQKSLISELRKKSKAIGAAMIDGLP